MRTLIYVPVIHTSADLGSLAKDVTKRGIADLGEDIWEKHKAIVEKFWDAISIYFDYADKQALKIYQDGMVADGEIGKKIVEEGARSGSRNYQLVWRLLKKGAVLVKTEDFILVKEERDRLLALTQAKSVRQKLIALIKYKLIKNVLLNKRDKSIAKRINETLNDNERGVLFIGAFHNIKKWLAKDIQINQIKDVRKIREYHKLLPFCNKYKERFDKLAMYLVSKVKEE